MRVRKHLQRRSRPPCLRLDAEWCVPLIDWAQVQLPPVSWADAKLLAASGRIQTIERPARWRRRWKLHVPLDPRLIDQFGPVVAARHAGWHPCQWPPGSGRVPKLKG